jgi:hypothetical protein
MELPVTDKLPIETGTELIVIAPESLNVTSSALTIETVEKLFEALSRVMSFAPAVRVAVPATDTDPVWLMAPVEVRARLLTELVPESDVAESSRMSAAPAEVRVRVPKLTVSPDWSPRVMDAPLKLALPPMDMFADAALVIAPVAVALKAPLPVVEVLPSDMAPAVALSAMLPPEALFVMVPPVMVAADMDILPVELVTLPEFKKLPAAVTALPAGLRTAPAPMVMPPSASRPYPDRFTMVPEPDIDTLLKSWFASMPPVDTVCAAAPLKVTVPVDVKTADAATSQLPVILTALAPGANEPFTSTLAAFTVPPGV